VVLLAAATLLVNLRLGVDWRLALAAALVVALFGEITGRLLKRRQLAVSAVVGAPPGIFPGPASHPSSPHPLSRREVEVAALVARGLTNKEIGTRLFISERTVDNHVQHAYQKLDIGSRSELAVWVRDHGLLGTVNSATVEPGR
jgi:DNA-binding NarL/FixJ family response regulator